MSASDLGLHSLLHNPRASGTRPQSFWERVGEQGLHTGLRELSSLPIKKTRSKKMADARELQTNLTEYRAQLRQASYLIRQFYGLILNDTYI